MNCYQHLYNSNSLRQTVRTHYASVYQAAKLAAALLRVAGVTAGLAESNGSLPPGLWLTSPAGWLPRAGISSGTLRLVIEYGLPFYFQLCDTSSTVSGVLIYCWEWFGRICRKNWCVRNIWMSVTATFKTFLLSESSSSEVFFWQIGAPTIYILMLLCKNFALKIETL